VSDYINELVTEYSYVRNFCDTAPVEENKYEVKPMQAPAWILHSLGYIAQDIFEPAPMGEIVYAPVLMVQAAKDWLLKYDEAGRYDIWQKAFQSVARALSQYEEEAFFRVILPACTSHFNGNILAELSNIEPISAPIAQPNPPAKYCAVELIHRMAQVMKTRGQILDTVMVSPEDMSDLKEYSEEDDFKVNEEVFSKPGGTLSFKLGDDSYEVKTIVSNALGIKGRYNLNDRTSEFGPFIGQGEENKFNDYIVTNGNVLDENARLVKAGETQIYGFSKEVKNYMKMPIVQPYTAYWDPNLVRRDRSGFYGKQKLAALCLNNKCLVMGIIDRSD
jgi:hypothetical protein